MPPDASTTSTPVVPADMSTSIVTPATSASLSFTPAALSHTRFDPAPFIAERRAHIPLRVLRDDLDSYITGLQRMLVVTVQQNFATFVSFGDLLNDVHPLAHAAVPALHALRKQLVALEKSLAERIHVLEAILETRRQLKGRVAALEGLLVLAALVDKVERLLREYRDSRESERARLRLVERIAAEMAQMRFVEGRATKGRFVDALKPRMRKVADGVDACLENWLRRGLEEQGDLLATVLGLYVVVGDPRKAETVFRRMVVVPFARDRLRMANMLANAERTLGNAVTPADALIEAKKEVVAFLGEHVMMLVSLVDAEERLRSKLDFVGNAVWPEIEAAIGRGMTAAFSPGIPDVFHKSVRAGMGLYEAVEIAAGECGKQNIKTNPVTERWWRRWNLPVYFQLRFQEVTTTFDAMLQEGMAGKGNEQGVGMGGLLRTDVYAVKGSVGLVEGLKRCWSEQVFLEALTHRFFRLSLQMLARYVTWVRTGLAGEWRNEDAGYKGVVKVFCDVRLLQTRLPGELASVLRLRVKGLDEELLDRMDEMVLEAMDKWSDLLPELETSIVDGLITTCKDNLGPLRGILATYRMSSKQAPTTHSTFVPKILRPLKLFIKEQETKIGKEECVRMAKKVVQGTASEYYDMATDLLQRNRSSEATLRRLNIGKTGGGMSVIDKISMQLYLDVAKFRDDVKAFGVDVDDVASLVKLWQSVKREDKSEQKNEDEDEEKTEQQQVGVEGEKEETKNEEMEGDEN